MLASALSLAVLSYKSAAMLADEMFLPDLNTRQIKKAYYHTIHLYREETRTIRSQAQGFASTSGSMSGVATPDAVEGWFPPGTHFESESGSTSEYGTESESECQHSVPIPVQELVNEVG